MNKNKIISILLILSVVMGLVGCSEEVTYNKKEFKSAGVDVIEIENPKGGAVLTLSKNSPINILDVKEKNVTYAFKDINNNGKLDPFEDWRLTTEERVEDLVEYLSLEQKAGLMLFSSHETEPEKGLTEDQKDYLKNDKIRNVLNAGPNDVEDNVSWVNEMQEYVELLSDDEIYIPVNFSSDPRNTAMADTYNADGDISRWPSHLGLSATFNPEYSFDYGRMSTQEYRALGITTALGPQIDVASDPRWLRVNGTFGESHELTIEMARRYMDGAQSTFNEDEDLGWGSESVNVMMKHFPGDGMGEGGRESHTDPGKYAVYPGNRFEEHVNTFIESGLNLSGKTNETASVMTSYSIGIDSEGNPIVGDKVATSYNKEKIDILRENNNYEGVIVTDWMVTGPMAFGVEDLSSGERHFEVLLGGTDMFGGNNDLEPVLEAYNIWETRHKEGEVEISADDRFDQSAKRILKMIMQVGLYENPYLNIEESMSQVASEEKVDKGYQAQLDSVVLLKNEEIIEPRNLEDWKDKVAYVPATYHNEFGNKLFGTEPYVSYKNTVDVNSVEQFFKEVKTDEIKLKEEEFDRIERQNNFSDVDIILVGLDSPKNGSVFSGAGKDDDGYYPLSLQYRPYVANSDHVRRESIAGDEGENRSYFNKKSRIANEYDLDTLEYAVEMGNKYNIPVIVFINADNPVVLEEIEPQAKAIVVGFGVSDLAKLEVALGLHEPQGRLPITFPKNMEAIEKSYEDVSFDVTPYVDSQGNVYEFGYGLDYEGVIDTQDIKDFLPN